MNGLEIFREKKKRSVKRTARRSKEAILSIEWNANVQEPREEKKNIKKVEEEKSGFDFAPFVSFTLICIAPVCALNKRARESNKSTSIKKNL